MAPYGINRPLTGQEKVEMTEIGTANVMNIFLKELAKKKTEITPTYLPFDSYCAKLDFEQRIKVNAEDAGNMVFNKESREQGFDGMKNLYKFSPEDLDKYSSSERFEFIKITDELKDMLVDGMKKQASIGKRFHYLCKHRGDRVSIFVPLEDVEEVTKKVNAIYKKEKPKTEEKVETAEVAAPKKKKA